MDINNDKTQDLSSSIKTGHGRNQRNIRTLILMLNCSHTLDLDQSVEIQRKRKRRRRTKESIKHEKKQQTLVLRKIYLKLWSVIGAK